MHIVGVPGLADVDEMLEFVADTGVDGVTHIPDPEGVLWDRFGVTRQRTYVFVNDDGTTETLGYGSLQADVEDLLAR
ncbi:MAG: hypothetical protein AAF567_05355 [Actinomycetota bacterium]